MQKTASERFAGAVATLRPATFHGCSNLSTVMPCRGNPLASAELFQ